MFKIIEIIESQTFKDKGDLILVLHEDKTSPLDPRSYNREAAEVVAALDSYLCMKTMEAMTRIMMAKYRHGNDLFDAVLQCARDLNKVVNEWENG